MGPEVGKHHIKLYLCPQLFQYSANVYCLASSATHSQQHGLRFQLFPFHNNHSMNPTFHTFLERWHISLALIWDFL